MPSPALDRFGFLSDVLVPLLRAFREEFGSERTDRVAQRVLTEWRRRFVAERHEGMPGRGRERWMAGFKAQIPEVGDALDMKMLKRSDEAFEFDVTGCGFARLSCELGEPELGYELVCALDYTAVEEIGEGEVSLTRTDSIMQGAERCDFRFAMKKSG